jgi:prepilin signal peptidase PulO-like enzyme (type II secretory pathway)
MIYILFILGLFFGSFLNAWVWRTKVSLSVARGRSMCTACKKQLVWYDNIPLFSFLFLRGKCRKCEKNISMQYPVVEFVTGGLFLFVAWYYQVSFASMSFVSLEFFRDIGIIFFLIAIFIYDLLYKEIWDRWTIFPAAVLFILAIMFGWHSWHSMLIGIAIGAGFFLLQYIVSRGKWIGGGDIRLGVFMGVILGWPQILLALMLAYISGAFIGIILILMKKKKLASETPFGTYLALATFVTMFWGERIVAWYLSLIKYV